MFFLVILIALSPLTHVSLSQGSQFSNTKISSIKLYLLAVTENGEGVVIRVSLEAYYPGNGSVSIIDNEGYIANDTKESILFALRASSLLTGIDYRFYNYRVVFPPNTKLGGISATLAFTLGFASLLEGDNVTKRIGVTGIIAPNLMVGNVSKIYVKYYAAMLRGLDYVIGPPTLSLLGRKSYKYVVDAYTAYKYFSNSSIIPYPMFSFSPPKKLAETFNKSYIEFKNMVDKVLNNVPNNTDIRGFMEYESANKAYARKQYYTAATYMFRSFIDSYTYIFTKNYLIKPSIIYSLEKWVSSNISITEEIINNYIDKLRHNLNMWNLDTVFNAYIRYKQAVMYQDLADTTVDNITRKIELYVISLARTFTVRHWLGLFIDDSPSNSEILSNQALGNILDYVDVSIRYLSTEPYVSPDIYKNFTNITLSIHDRIRRFLELGWLYYMLNYYLTFYRGLFDLFISPKTIIDLNYTLKGLGLLLYAKTGSPSPTFLTTIELLNYYFDQGENLNTEGFLAYTSMSILTYEMLLLRKTLPKMENIHVITPKTSAKTDQGSLNKYYDIPIVIAASLGSLLLGYIIGKNVVKPKNSLTESSVSYPGYSAFESYSLSPGNPSRAEDVVLDSKELLQGDK